MNLEAKLTTICGQVETVRADAITGFKTSLPFIDACVVYYGDRFEDYLKQVRSVYPNLDLSKVTMDNLLPTTPARGDIVSKETSDSIESERDLKDDGVVLVQPAVEGPSFLQVHLLMILLLITPRTSLPRTPRTFSFNPQFLFYFLFFFNPLFFQTVVNALVFWALFVNTFYLWRLFNILHLSLLVFFAMC